MIIQKQKPPTPWPLIVLFSVITTGAVLVGILYYNYQKKNLLTEKQLELSAIADLKIRQITQWRLDRVGNANFLGENTLLVERMSKFVTQPDLKSLRKNVLQSLKSLTENFDYKSALLLDTLGNVRLGYPLQDLSLIHI